MVRMSGEKIRVKVSTNYSNDSIKRNKNVLISSERCEYVCMYTYVCFYNSITDFSVVLCLKCCLCFERDVFIAWIKIVNVL